MDSAWRDSLKPLSSSSEWFREIPTCSPDLKGIEVKNANSPARRTSELPYGATVPELDVVNVDATVGFFKPNGLDRPHHPKKLVDVGLILTDRYSYWRLHVIEIG